MVYLIEMVVLILIIHGDRDIDGIPDNLMNVQLLKKLTINSKMKTVVLMVLSGLSALDFDGDGIMI